MEPHRFLDFTSSARLSTAMRQPLLRGLKAASCTFWGSTPKRSAVAVGLRFSRGLGPPTVGLRSYRKKAVAQQQQPPVKPEEVTLRKYQLECIQAVVNSFKQGHKRVGVSLATGGGKTVCDKLFSLRLSSLKFDAIWPNRPLILMLRLFILWELQLTSCRSFSPTSSRMYRVTPQLQLGL